MARPLLLTASGDAKLSTAQYKFGTASAVFDGTGDKITADATSDISGLSNFTVEAWVRCGSNTAQFNNVICQAGSSGAYTTSGYWSLRTRFNNVEQVAFTLRHDAGWLDVTTNFAVNDNTWHHIAAVKSGSSITLYVDGVSKGTGSNAQTIGLSTEPVVVGNIGGAVSGEGGFIGYIDEIRVSNTARYSSTFTPSTSQFVNDDNTLLLIHANGTNNSTTFLDDASSNVLLSSNFSLDVTTSFLKDDYYIVDGYFTPNGYYIREIVGESSLTSSFDVVCDAEEIVGGEIVEAFGSWNSEFSQNTSISKILTGISDQYSEFSKEIHLIRIRLYSLTIVSSSSISCDAERIIPITEVSAALSGEFTQTASIDKLVGISSSLSSQFTQVTTIEKTIQGNSNLSSAFTQASDISKVTGYNAAISSEASIAATGYKIIEFAIDAGAMFSPSFEVSVIVNPFSTIESVFTFSAVPVANRSTSITLDTIGDLNAQAVKTVDTISTVTAEAILSSTVTRTAGLESTLTSSATLSADALNVQFAAAALTSSASLTFAGNISNKRPRIYTVVGSPTLSSSVKKFGAGSLNVSLGFGFTVPDSNDWTSTVGTIDFWIYRTATTQSTTVVQQSDGAGYYYDVTVGSYIQIQKYVSSVLKQNWYNASVLTSADNNNWVHIRICDSGSALTIWKNGSKLTPVSSGGNAYVYNNSSANVAQPLQLFNSGGSGSATIFIDELLITSEVLTASSVSTFTPPSDRWKPTDQSQIKLLSHYDTDYSDDMGLWKDAAATLSSAFTQTAEASKINGPSAAALVSTASLTANVETFSSVSAELTSNTALTAQAGYLSIASANVSVESSVTAAATRTLSAEAAIAATATLTAEGLDIDFAEAALSVTASLTGAVNRTAKGASAITAQGFVVAVIGELQSDVANLVSTSTISITAQKLKVSTAALTATSELALQPVRYPFRPNGYNDGNIEPIVGYAYWDVLGVKDIKVPAFGTYETGTKTIFTFGPYSLTATKSGTFPDFTNTFTFNGVSASTTSFDVDRYVWLYIRRGVSTLLGNMDPSGYANLQQKTLGTIDFDASSASIQCLGGTETDLMIAREGYMDGLSEPYYHAFGWIEYGNDWWTANRPAGYNITGVPWKFKDQDQVLGLYNTYGSLDDISSYILVTPVTWTSTATLTSLSGITASAVSNQTVSATMSVDENYKFSGAADLTAACTISCSGTRIRFGVESASSEFSLTADNVRTRDLDAAIASEFAQVTDNSRTRDNDIATEAIATQLTAVAKNATGTILLESSASLTANVNAIKDQPFEMSAAATMAIQASKQVKGSSSITSQFALTADGFKSQEGFINAVSAFTVLALTEDSKRVEAAASVVGAFYQITDGAKVVNPTTAVSSSADVSAEGSRTRAGNAEVTSAFTVTGSIKRTRDYNAALSANGFVLSVGDVINIDPFLTLRVTQETRTIQVLSETRAIKVEQETRVNIIQGY